LRPPPPFALAGGKSRVARLSDGASERVENAGILPDSCLAARFAVKKIAGYLGQFINTGDAEKPKIDLDRLADAGEISEPGVRWGG
jgi:hypothetical protein